MSYAGVIKVLTQVEKDFKKVGDSQLLKDVQVLSRTLAEVEGTTAAEQEEKFANLSSALAQAKKTITAYKQNKWSGKVIKTKKLSKAKASIQASIDTLVKDTSRAVMILQVIAAIQLQKTDSDQHTVLWVDDHPDNNSKEVDKAKDEGIKVVQKKSTAEAMAWLSENAALKTATPATFRVVTDFHRDDEGDGAAASLIKSMRNQGWETPVLIYCGEKVNVQDLQASYSNVLTSTSDTLLLFYFESMAETAIAFEEEEKEEPVKKGRQHAKKAATKAKVDDDGEGEAPEEKAATTTTTTTTEAKRTSTPPVKEEDKEEETPPVKKSGSKLAAAKKAASKIEEEPAAEEKPAVKKSSAKKAGAKEKSDEEEEEKVTEDREETPPPAAKKSASKNAKKAGKAATPEKELEEEKKEDEESKTKTAPKKSASKNAKKAGTKGKATTPEKEDDSDEMEETPEKSPTVAKKSSGNDSSPTVPAKPASKPDLAKKTSKPNAIGGDDSDEEEAKPKPAPKKTAAKPPPAAAKKAPELKLMFQDESQEAPTQPMDVEAKSADAPKGKAKTTAAAKKTPPKAKEDEEEKQEDAMQVEKPASEPAWPPNCTFKRVTKEGGIQAGQVVEFQIEAKDKKKQPLKGSAVVVEFKHEATATTSEAFIDDNDNGSYTAKMLPAKSGKYQIKATVDGKVIFQNSVVVTNSPASATNPKKRKAEEEAEEAPSPKKPKTTAAKKGAAKKTKATEEEDDDMKVEEENSGLVNQNSEALDGGATLAMTPEETKAPAKGKATEQDQEATQLMTRQNTVPMNAEEEKSEEKPKKNSKLMFADSDDEDDDKLATPPKKVPAGAKKSAKKKAASDDSDGDPSSREAGMDSGDETPEKKPAKKASGSKKAAPAQIEATLVMPVEEEEEAVGPTLVMAEEPEGPIDATLVMPAVEDDAAGIAPTQIV